jgi:Flp pilus assembly protein TadG
MADASAEPDRRLSAGRGGRVGAMLDRRFRGGRLGAAFVALGLVFVALTVWAGFLADKTYAADTRKSDIAAVQKVANRVVTNFYGISYQSFDQDTQRVYADLDSAFKAQAVQQLGSSWKQTVVGNQLVSSAVVYASGVVNISAKSAEVMVTVKRTSHSTQVKTPVSSWASAQVQLAKRGGDWKVSGMGGLQ